MHRQLLGKPLKGPCLIVDLAGLSLEAGGSGITEIRDRGGSFKEIILVRWCLSRLFDDRFCRSADEGALVLRAWDLSGDDEEGRREAEAIHDRNGHVKLVDAAVVVG